MPGPYEPVGAVAFVCPERVGGAVRARRWRAVRAPRSRRPRTWARPALTGQGAVETSRDSLLLQVKTDGYAAATARAPALAHGAAYTSHR
jgi:hypothetical protein